MIHRTVRDSRDGVANERFVNRTSHKAPIEKVTNAVAKAIFVFL